ncbi:hypothetical protein BCR44DRAFT_47523 [Catenaria anguillulae PL171]|uniref:Histone deacetylase domain-containing protein n=1 Tax=Catenaria anguillulae PL171 TaxID=765915 RepID=A0A1Y2HUS2_9FUNG|nr:hypothetical protein BCR44DRAFT_47523 [Catenaria anguillulae PL171]
MQNTNTNFATSKSFSGKSADAKPVSADSTTPAQQGGFTNRYTQQSGHNNSHSGGNDQVANVLVVADDNGQEPRQLPRRKARPMPPPRTPKAPTKSQLPSIRFLPVDSVACHMAPDLGLSQVRDHKTHACTKLTAYNVIGKFVGTAIADLRDGMYQLSRMAAGESIEAARHINSSNVDFATNWAGGLHHAKKGCAYGFCYVNDIVLAIMELLRSHGRVLDRRPAQQRRQQLGKVCRPRAWANLRGTDQALYNTSAAHARTLANAAAAYDTLSRAQSFADLDLDAATRPLRHALAYSAHSLGELTRARRDAVARAINCPADIMRLTQAFTDVVAAAAATRLAAKRKPSSGRADNDKSSKKARTAEPRRKDVDRAPMNRESGGKGRKKKARAADGMDDAPYVALFKSIMEQVMQTFRPGAIVLVQREQVAEAQGDADVRARLSGQPAGLGTASGRYAVNEWFQGERDQDDCGMGGMGGEDEEDEGEPMDLE